MSNYSDIRRKHYRFPAYNDDEGVKIQREEKRNLFANDRSWLITDEKDFDRQPDPVERKRESAFSKRSEAPDRTLRRSRRETMDKQGLTINQKKELKKHRDNLPDYSRKAPVEVDAVGRTSLFGKEPRTSSLRNPTTRAERSGADGSLKRQYSGRSYFVPKYIPASVIPEKKEGEVSKAELLASMEKPKENFLTFDTEAAAYQEKKEDAPSVSKFPAEEVVNTKNTSADSKRETVSSDERRRSVLDRSLSGMIEEADNSDKNGYFSRKDR